MTTPTPLCRVSAAVAAAAVALVGIANAAWEPMRFSNEETLEFLTVGPEEGEHWSTVWLVVLEGDVYIRLGTRAAERMEQHTGAPLVDIRIAGEEFSDVRVVPTPDQAEAVAEAMAEKYWSDIFIKYFDHPLTARLEPTTAVPTVTPK